jgi:extradiol dioxygenase family protein
VPVPHVGVVPEPADWHALAGRLRAGGADFVIEPHVRFAGRPGEHGEQATLFLLGPSGNALEFKAFADIEGQLFARQRLRGGAAAA